MLDTQANAYQEVKQDAAYKRNQIMERAMLLPDFTTREMADSLKWGFHQTQPRISELLSMGLIIDTGKRRIGRVKESAVWAINHNPQPQKKRMKPVGNKELWGKMIQSAYAHSAQPNAHHIYAMQQAAIAWITDFSNNLTKQKKSVK